MLVDLLAKYMTAEEKREHRERLLSTNTKKTAKGKSPEQMGKSLVPAKKSFLGKLFGKKQTEQEEVPQISPPEQTLGEIFKMLKVMDEDKKLNQEQVNNHIEEEEKKKNDRNEEIIKAITGRPVKGKKGDRAKRRKNDKKLADAESKNVSKTTSKPSTAPKTHTKVTNTPVAYAGVTARQVACAAVVAGGLGMAAAVGAAESGGNYDISFGDRVDKSTGKIVNQKGFETAESRYGKKLTELTLAQVDELGKARNRKSANSSAMGKYQFMNSTLFGRNVFDKNTGKTIHTPGLVEQLNLSMDTKFSPQIQDRLQEHLAKQDAAALQKQGIPLTPGYQYMAHYIGAGGAGSVYRAVKDGKDLTVAQAMVADGKGDPSPNNPELAKIKAKDFEKVLEGRLAKNGLSTPHASYDQTETLDKKSVENKNLRQESSAQEQKVNKDTTNNFVTSKQKQGQEETKKEDDSPVIIKKNR